MCLREVLVRASRRLYSGRTDAVLASELLLSPTFDLLRLLNGVDKYSLMRVSVCVLLQVVLVFCLWSTDVSRAYVFQASRPDGGDNPPTHTKGEIRRIFSCLVGSDPNAWKHLLQLTSKPLERKQEVEQFLLRVHKMLSCF